MDHEADYYKLFKRPGPGQTLPGHPILPVTQNGGPPYLQAVGAWLRRRRLVRLEEDLLAPPEELDNSDEDVVQHQDHASRHPPAPPARPARCARSARPQQLRRSARGSAPVPPRPRPALGFQAPPTSLPPGTAPQRLPKIRPHQIPADSLPPGRHPPKTAPAGRLWGSPLLGRLFSLCCAPLIPSPLLFGRAPPRVPCTAAPHSPHHLDFSSPARAQRPSPAQWRERAAVAVQEP